MSRFYFIDAETIPLPEDRLIEMMPNNIANPIMPDDIKNPIMPEELFGDIPAWAEPSEELLMDGCPAYKSKSHPDGDPVKRAEYRKKRYDAIKSKFDEEAIRRGEKQKAWLEKSESKKMTWEEKAIEAKQKFIDDAALSAVTGSVKLIGIRDYVNRRNVIHVAGATEEQKGLLNAAFYPQKTTFLFWETEQEMLSGFAMDVTTGDIVTENDDNESDFKLIGYFTHGFDFPFIFRRAWITGAKVAYLLRKGRYFNGDVSIDLCEAWQLGDRQAHTGGLDGLAKILGTKRKSGNGESFHRLWNESPVAAVLYLIDDLDVSEEAGEKMGVVYKPKPSTPFPAKVGK